MGRTEFLTETDCERALVGRAKAKASTRAKWRSSPSACRRVLEKCLTPPTLLEMGMFHQSLGGEVSDRLSNQSDMFYNLDYGKELWVHGGIIHWA
jgi:hypothetical protein